MSAILAVTSLSARAPDPPVVDRMMGAMRRRGADHAAARQVGVSALLGVSRFAWEMEPGFGGRALVVQEDELAVVADASLYYRRDLERELRARGVRIGGDTPTHLILAAYRAWGAECARHLEGDFAFVVWDARQRSVFAARDFAAKRPLFHALLGDTLVIASTISGILAHPECPRELDLTVLAEETAALTGSPDQTCWRAVRRLPPGWSLFWRAGEPPRTSAHWEPPVFRDRGGAPFEEAAEELRELLCASVDERMSPSGSTVLWLSGGWDSPAVYGAGREALRTARDAGRTLDTVSVSFPPGDPGREDETITAVVRHWSAEPTWVRSSDIPPLERLAERALERDEPYPHPFETMNRALGRASRSRGARVALDGNGGDQLFQLSSVYLADLFAGGRWLELAREWRSRGGGGARRLLRDALLPALPSPLLLRVATLGAAHRLVDVPERRPPVWMRPGFVREHALAERERAHAPRRMGCSRAAHEVIWQFSRPMLGRMMASLSAYGLDEGVEQRSPLYDARILRFAGERPVSDRRMGPETKRLLRSAVRGLVPEEVLAPRPYRTGSPVRYLTTAIEAELPAMIERTMRESMLGDLGIIDPAVLRREWEDGALRGDLNQRVALYLTIEAELWLRARGTLSEERQHAAVVERGAVAMVS